MDCSICGRPVLVEHLGTKPTTLCEACADHEVERCWPRCGACRIKAMVGHSMGAVRRLTRDEMLAIMWPFEKGAVVWSTAARNHLVVISPDLQSEAYALTVDEKGWCKRRYGS